LEASVGRFGADLLMTVGALIVLVGSLLSSSPDAQWIILAGIALAILGFLFDRRNVQRALVLGGIAVSWVTIIGAAVFAVLLTVLLINRFRRSARE